MKNTEITPKEREKVHQRDGIDGCPCCIKCGSPYLTEQHHYIPRSQGGMGIAENLVTLCKYCHSKVESPEMKSFIRDYLSRHYEGWNEEKLIYRKWK